MTYKCARCGWSTTDKTTLRQQSGCCGRKSYLCPKCGRKDVKEMNTAPVVVRVSGGHSGTIVRKTK